MAKQKFTHFTPRDKPAKRGAGKHKKNKNKPRVIIAHTIKGKGISFMENNNLWHYKNPTIEELKLGLNEIKKNYA